MNNLASQSPYVSPSPRKKKFQQQLANANSTTPNQESEPVPSSEQKVITVK
jgi:hypothetical protein